MSIFCKNVYLKFCFLKYFSEQMCSPHDKNLLNTPMTMFGEMLGCSFIWTFVIASLWYTEKLEKKIEKLEK